MMEVFHPFFSRDTVSNCLFNRQTISAGQGEGKPDMVNSKTLQISRHRIYLDKTSGGKTAK